MVEILLKNFQETFVMEVYGPLFLEQRTNEKIDMVLDIKYLNVLANIQYNLDLQMITVLIMPK